MRYWKSVTSATLIVMAAFTIIVYSACKKEEYTYVDECADVSCQNGANCFKGTCLCPAGFSGDFCEDVWLSRYLGRWEVKQTIAISNKDGRQWQESSYFMTVKRKGNSNTSFLIDGFMGNPAYNNVPCKIGVNNDGGFDVSTKFIFTNNHTVAGTQIVIEEGEGNVNFLGQNMGGNFSIHYTEVDTNGYPFLVQETMTFTATFN